MTKTKLFFITALLGTGACIAQTPENKEEPEKNFQITFITPMGTNGLESSKTINKFSVNIFAGVSKGVDGAEFGGFVNTNLKDMKGFQAAGFANVVHGSVSGTQLAGLANYHGKNMRGAALSGFCNVGIGNMHGAQLAGFCNANLGALHGAQLAGFCNYNHKNSEGIQAAGFMNVSFGSHKGTQLAGFGNITNDSVTGTQVAGFLNKAKKVKGLQIGIINIADSVDGASIGLLNIVKKGMHQVELSADELFYTNLSFRMGSYKFYNIFNVGTTARSGAFLWNIGYGLGTSLRINNKLRTDITASAYHISNGLFYYGTSELYKIYVGVEYKLTEKCHIAAGPTLNLYWTDALLGDYVGKYNNIAPYSAFNLNNPQGFNFKGWVGGRVAIRFL